MKKKKWFHVYVKCVSTERFDVQATSEQEARTLYEKGDAELVKDEVEDRTLISVEALA